MTLRLGLIQWVASSFNETVLKLHLYSICLNSWQSNQIRVHKKVVKIMADIMVHSSYLEMEGRAKHTALWDPFAHMLFCIQHLLSNVVGHLTMWCQKVHIHKNSSMIVCYSKELLKQIRDNWFKMRPILYFSLVWMYEYWPSVFLVYLIYDCLLQG